MSVFGKFIKDDLNYFYGTCFFSVKTACLLRWGGMTNGLRQAGINVIAVVDLDSEAKETYEVNNAPTRFVNADITKLP